MDITDARWYCQESDLSNEVDTDDDGVTSVEEDDEDDESTDVTEDTDVDVEETKDDGA